MIAPFSRLGLQFIVLSANQQGNLPYT